MEEHTPFLKRKSTLVGGAVGLTIIITLVSLNQNSTAPAPAQAAGGKPAVAQGNASATSLGSAGQTAEFNQTFAQRLREEQASNNARVEQEVKREIEQRVAAEAERIRTENRNQAQEILQRMEALTAAQQAATAAQEERNRQERGKDHKFVAPRAANDHKGVNRIAEDEATQAPVGVVRSVIPPNGFVRGRLLNGVVATVGDAPTAFLVALEGTYKAANGATVDLNGCMATVEGRPNLAAGRIEGKPAEITCNFEQEGRVQTWQVGGWIVDADDGIRGLSSVIVDNTGKKITAAGLAQALAVAGQALNESQYSGSSNSYGTSRTFTGSPEKAVLGGALAGAGQGLNTAIAEHYALYKPTLQKGANSQVSLVITNELPVPQQGAHITNNTNVVDGRKK